MARPLKDGADYFPKDTAFYQDDKIRLLRAEFGAKGMYLLDYLLCDLYGKNGYFIKWDRNKCFLVSDGAGCGCSPEFIEQFIQGCSRCSFFDERVLKAFGVLTSAGIQRRYIRMFNSRDEIQIIEEYWLLDSSNKKDVPAGVLNKLAFKSIKTCENPDKTYGNPDKTSNNSQSKVKESKVKESKESSGASAPPPTPKPDRKKYGKYGWVKLSDMEYKRLAAEYGMHIVNHYIGVVDEKAQMTGNKNKWKDWNLTVRNAIRNQWSPRPSMDTAVSLYDDDDDFFSGKR